MKLKWSKPIILCFSFCVLVLLSRGQSVRPLHLSDNREIFVDHYLIDSLRNVRLIMHHPIDKGPVFYFNKPWEGPFCNYATVIKDGDYYRLYYRGTPGGKDGDSTEVTCLIESKDGIHWERPDFKLFKRFNSYNNNIILTNAPPSSHNFSPFIDRNPAAQKDQQYKALALGRGGLLAYTSPDGIHWKKLDDAPVITQGAFDSQNVSFWSTTEHRYICYFRTWTKGKFKGIRTVSRVTSSDFIHWSAPQEMTFGNTPLENIYIQQTSPYFRAPQLYLAIGARFMPNREVVSSLEAKRLHVNPNYYKDCSDVVLMSTRGGNAYARTFMESFIRPGIGLDNWVSRTNYPALNVVPTGTDEMSIYLVQDYAQPTIHLERYTLRLDGFTSINAPYQGGELITKSFIFSGKQLEINYSTSAAGDIKIGIEDANGTSIPGFGLEQSDIIIGNEIQRVVSWNGASDIHQLAGKPIRLIFSMKDADLYSFKFD